jgi:hypothetical protein
MEWKWIILFLVLCNIILTILLTQKKKNKSTLLKDSPSPSPSTIGPCALGCITYLAKSKVCSKDDIENINKGLPITPTCALALGECATAYCCSPFCIENQSKCDQIAPPDGNIFGGIYDLSYYFPI